jgi:hypothetical protein
LTAQPSLPVDEEPSSRQLLLEIALVLLMSVFAEASMPEATTPPGPTSRGGHDERAGGVEIERGGHPTVYTLQPACHPENPVLRA